MSRQAPTSLASLESYPKIRFFRETAQQASETGPLRPPCIYKLQTVPQTGSFEGAGQSDCRRPEFGRPKVMVVLSTRTCAIPMPAPTNAATGPGFSSPSAARSTKPASIPDTDDRLAETSCRRSGARKFARPSKAKSGRYSTSSLGGQFGVSSNRKSSQPQTGCPRARHVDLAPTAVDQRITSHG